MLRTEMYHTKVINTEDKNYLVKELEETNKIIDQLYSDRLDKKISEDLWERKNAEMETKVKDIKMRLEGSKIVHRGNIVECMRRIDNIARLPKMFREGSYVMQREIARMVFSSVTLKGRILSFEYAWPFKYFLKMEDDEVEHLEHDLTLD